MKPEQFYRLLPVSLQNVLCSVYGWRERRVRFGEEFWDKYRWLLAMERAQPEDIERYQSEQIGKLVQHAYATVPYYRHMMDREGIAPADINSREDLRKLPILTKEEVVQHRQELRSQALQGPVRPAKTSGTTGTALSFVTTKEAVAFQWAVWWRHRSRFGITPGMLHLNFTGKPVVPISQRDAPYWRWNWPMRQAIVSMQHLGKREVAAIVEFINAHEFRYFSGYPSLIFALASAAQDAGLEVTRRPSHIFLGAENVQANHKAVIERVFGGKVTDQYGFTEGCGNASRCEFDNYHEDWEFGVLDRIDEETLEDGSVRGRIVATGFANYAFPFLRYEVGDIGVWAPEGFECPCGRVGRVLLRIEGRNEDYVLTPEGARIMRFDYIFKDTANIREAQVVQREHGAILIRLVPRSGFSQEDESKLKSMIREWVSPSLKVQIEKVSEIPRGRNAKFRPVVSELGAKSQNVDPSTA